MNNIINNDWWSKKRLEVRQQIKDKFNYKSIMEVTDIDKIVLNSGVGGSADQAAIHKERLIDTQKAIKNIAQGQTPTITKAKKSIINFKIREGMSLGCKVTLRKKRAWDFLFELININLSLINNFQGLSVKSFSKDGSYNLGLNNLNIFPTVPYDLTFKGQGLQITIVFKSKNYLQNKLFLNILKFPLVETKDKKKPKN